MKKPFWLVAWLLAIEVVVILLFMPGDWTKTAIIKEGQYVTNTLGQDSARWVQSKATQWYESSMIDSGFLDALHKHVLPSKEEKARSRGMETAWDPWFNWLTGRLDAFSKVVYQFFSRLALAWIWLPYMAILFLPALYDGMNMRRIKRTNFDYASPVIHRYSVRSATALIMGLLIAFFFPVAIDPIIIPIVLMCTCILVGLGVSNMQKRI